MNILDPDRLYDVHDVADRLGVSESQVRRMWRTGDGPATVKIGRLRKVTGRQLQEYIALLVERGDAA